MHLDKSMLSCFQKLITGEADDKRKINLVTKELLGIFYGLIFVCPSVVCSAPYDVKLWDIELACSPGLRRNFLRELRVSEHS
jgi:hypothetical protein